MPQQLVEVPPHRFFRIPSADWQVGGVIAGVALGRPAIYSSVRDSQNSSQNRGPSRSIVASQKRNVIY